MRTAIAGISSIFVRLSLILLGCTLIHSAVGQSAVQPQSHVIPIEHYYWHFLVHQNQLDQLASARVAKGQDGSWLRNHLQNSLGFSDADFALVRASATRLSVKIKALNAQAVAIRSADPPSAEAYAQLKALNGQRETAINTEVLYIRQSLSPDKIARLEAFMVQFFSHTTAGSPPSLATGKTAPTAVPR